jgi:tRNA-dihydrouridine synthase 2
MVRMNTQPFRELCAKADLVFSEEIIDRKLIWCQRIENDALGTIDFVSTRDQSLVFRTRPSEKHNLIL